MWKEEAKVTKQEKTGRARWNIFFYHLLIFVGVHLIFIPLFGVVPLSELGSDSYFDYIADHFVNHGINIYQNNTVNKIVGIWKTILMIHLVIEIIETLFPTKKKKQESDISLDKEKQMNAEVIESLDQAHKDISTQSKESVKKAWIYLLIAGLLEIIWATALKMDMLGGPIIIVLIISFELLIKAVKSLGIGIAYSVFTGIGVVGMVIVDFVLFKEALSIVKLSLVLLLVLFIIGLQFSSEQEGVK